MARASVVGAGMTTFGPHERTLAELFADAALEALDDAGTTNDSIDAFYLGNTLGGMTENETHLAPKLATHVGINGVPAQRFEDACATSSNAFKHAVQAVENGVHDVVLVGGVERCTPETGLDTPRMTEIFASASDRQYEQPAGITFPGVFALLTKRHMHEYGTTEEQLASVAVKNHANGQHNPHAHFGKEATVEEVLESPLIADPFRLMDCCPFSDGASAVVVVGPDAADSFDSPVDVNGVGHATGTVPAADKESLTATQPARDAAASAYEQAGRSAADVDFAEVHDCFTGAEILATEALGFFDDGEGGPAAEAGRTALDGEIPINPSGGLKAKGHPIGATGTAQIVELTTQLRGEAGDRQIADAETGLAHNLGGDAGTTLVTLMEARA
ncbi:thiolase domain-containing protein [Natrinema amylolyticum]|uniref:thiolase domain-containing protein n=1 Tax=Natrinema amylolyticum TaxID=2878679 RepID=UPI001CFA01CB|nr:thiolase domain-containing protein [Natrinema amylolyticum]